MAVASTMLTVPMVSPRLRNVAVKEGRRAARTPGDRTARPARRRCPTRRSGAGVRTSACAGRKIGKKKPRRLPGGVKTLGNRRRWGESSELVGGTERVGAAPIGYSNGRSLVTAA